MAKPTTSYAVGGQVTARRPGNEPVTPARREVRGRAQAVRSSTTTAYLCLEGPLHASGAFGSAKLRALVQRGTAPLLAQTRHVKPILAMFRHPAIFSRLNY